MDVESIKMNLQPLVESRSAPPPNYEDLPKQTGATSSQIWDNLTITINNDTKRLKSIE